MRQEKPYIGYLHSTLAEYENFLMVVYFVTFPPVSLVNEGRYDQDSSPTPTPNLSSTNPNPIKKTNVKIHQTPYENKTNKKKILDLKIDTQRQNL